MQEQCHGEEDPAMSKTPLKAFVQLVADGALTRRNLVRGLAGTAMATSLFHAELDILEARKRKQGKKRKRKGQGNDQGDGRGNDDSLGGEPGGGDTGPGGNECPLTLC